MNLRKSAISGIMLAGSMVVMCAIADAASTVSAEAVAVVSDTSTDLATDVSSRYCTLPDHTWCFSR